MWLWLVVARAEPVGHWHPDDLAPLSTVFRSSSERLQEPFTDRERSLSRLAAALRQYREALDLLGEDASAPERERLTRLEGEFATQRKHLSAFADKVITDYDAAFMASVQRALAAHGGEIEECPDQLAEGPAMPGMPSRAKKNPDCHGPDINALLAAKTDEDLVLKSALDEILSRTWPEVSLASEPAAPVGGTDRYLLVRDLFIAGAKEKLAAIDRADDEARVRIEAALEDGASPDELAKLEIDAKKIAAETAARRANLATGVLSVARARIEKKWSTEPSTGWCANPIALGGCSGEDTTSALVARMLDDKKIAKALAAAK